MDKYLEILAVDDNPAHLSDLKAVLSPVLEERGFHWNLHQALNPASAQMAVQPDLIFLDVELEKCSGLDLAASLHTRYPESLVVLMSSWPRYSIEGYKTGALRFLPKPFDEKMVHSVLDDSFFDALKNTRTLYHPDLFDRPVPVRSILYVESSTRHTQVHFDKGRTLETSLTLKEWKELARDASFIQVYKSILVNPAWIENLDADTKEVVLKNGQRVPYSRHFKKDIQEQLQEYIWSSL